MSQNVAKSETQDATTLHSLGAVISTIDPAHPGKTFTYVATHAQDPSKGLTLELSAESKRLAAQPQPRNRKYAALEKFEPSAKPALSPRVVALQQRARPAFRAQARALASLKARTPVAAAPQPAVAPKAPTLAKTITMAGNQLQTTKNKVVSAQRPGSLAAAEQRWSQSAGYIQLKFG